MPLSQFGKVKDKDRYGIKEKFSVRILTLIGFYCFILQLTKKRIIFLIGVQQGYRGNL